MRKKLGRTLGNFLFSLMVPIEEPIQQFSFGKSVEDSRNPVLLHSQQVLAKGTPTPPPPTP